MSEARPRIVEAMVELADLRDAGEPVHLMISEVADAYNVPAAEVERRAVASWGAPLQTDRERNASHFAAVDDRMFVINEARARANLLWHDMIPRGGKPLWFMSVKNWLDGRQLESASLEDEAKQAFMSEVKRLDALRKAGLIPDAED